MSPAVAVTRVRTLLVCYPDMCAVLRVRPSFAAVDIVFSDICFAGNVWFSF